MKFIIFLLLISNILVLEDVTFEKVMTDLKNLEKYIREYINEKKPEKTLTHLITCYIRLGGYTEQAWTIAGGTIPSDLPQYILDKDAAEGTSAQACQQYRDIKLPNNEITDFVHFFAVMNGIENGDSYSAKFAHLVGWGGDAFQLLQDIKNEQGEIEDIMKVAKEKYFYIKGGFDEGDYVADLDAPILLIKKNDVNDFADLMKDYYTTDKYLDRETNFVRLTFPDLKKKEDFRNVLYNIYDKDSFINVLECQDGMRKEKITCYVPGELLPQYANNQKAAVYVVSDYIAERFNP